MRDERSHRILWGFVRRRVAYQQSLIAITWRKDLKDLRDLDPDRPSLRRSQVERRLSLQNERVPLSQLISLLPSHCLLWGGKLLAGKYARCTGSSRCCHPFFWFSQEKANSTYILLP